MTIRTDMLLLAIGIAVASSCSTTAVDHVVTGIDSAQGAPEDADTASPADTES